VLAGYWDGGGRGVGGFVGFFFRWGKGGGVEVGDQVGAMSRGFWAGNVEGLRNACCALIFFESSVSFLSPLKLRTEPRILYHETAKMHTSRTSSLIYRLLG